MSLNPITFLCQRNHPDTTLNMAANDGRNVGIAHIVKGFQPSKDSTQKSSTEKKEPSTWWSYTLTQKPTRVRNQITITATSRRCACASRWFFTRSKINYTEQLLQSVSQKIHAIHCSNTITNYKNFNHEDWRTWKTGNKFTVIHHVTVLHHRVCVREILVLGELFGQCQKYSYWRLWQSIVDSCVWWIRGLVIMGTIGKELTVIPA